MQLAKELTTDQIKWHVENATHHLNVLRETMRVKKLETFPFCNDETKDKIYSAIAKISISSEFLQDFTSYYVNEIESIKND